MKLSDFFASGIMHKEAKLLIDIELDNGESMKAGEVGSVLKRYDNGEYHFEHNNFACRVKQSEIKFI